MPFTVEKLPDLPVVLLVQTSSRVMLEIDDILARLNAMLEGQAELVFLILDVRGVLMTLDELTAVASSAARGHGALLHNPKVRENLMVTTDGMLKLAAKGLKCDAFGGVFLQVFGTQERALAHCRAQIAETAGDTFEAQTG